MSEEKLARVVTAEAISEPLRAFVQFAVPVRIAQIRDRGGPSALDWQNLPALAGDIAWHGDEIQFGAASRRTTDARVGSLVEALAIGAFAPGGIEFLGLQFEASPA